MKPGATGWIVGYGTTGTQGQGGGVKRAVEVKINRAGNGITPCTDASGNWAPGPECNALQTAAMTGTGTFPTCIVQRTTGPISFVWCGGDAHGWQRRRDCG